MVKMKKLLGLILAIAMVFSFAGCGGSSSDETTGDDTAVAEPNAGIKGIVFTMPDGWELSEVTEGSYSLFSNADSEMEIGASVTDDEILKLMGDTAEADTVQEYYEKNFTYTDDTLAEINGEAEPAKVCGVDGTVLKVNNGDKGCTDISTSWMMDDVIYDLYMYNPDAYDDNGDLKKDALVLSDDDIALYESIMASVQPGDGAALQSGSINVDANNLGSITFETPEGFKVTSTSDSYVTLENKERGISLNLSYISEENLSSTSDENNNPYKSLQDYYDSVNYDGSEAATIAGCDGYLNIFPDEDDQYYSCDAGFMTDDAVYTIDYSTDAYDENGLKEDAVPLTDDDIATFKSFIESIQLK